MLSKLFFSYIILALTYITLKTKNRLLDHKNAQKYKIIAINKQILLFAFAEDVQYLGICCCVEIYGLRQSK